MDQASDGGIRWALLTARLSAVSIVAAIVVLVLAAGTRLAVRRADLPVIGLIGLLIVAADTLYALERSTTFRRYRDPR
ncbi:hypothetical protein [Nonomuraea sp. LPB2021202275-12-8]|uniref:hypothetical protein n=1 Tax=Nonomuraea sp. LPB2021202275-12-8 TaxID=3120159 RepID=UPI00300C0233